jgi:competence protein ComEC
VIIPVGYRNRFQHPPQMSSNATSGSRVWRTDRDGAVRMKLASGLPLSSYRTAYRRYWHGQ